MSLECSFGMGLVYVICVMSQVRVIVCYVVFVMVFVVLGMSSVWLVCRCVILYIRSVYMCACFLSFICCDVIILSLDCDLLVCLLCLYLFCVVLLCLVSCSYFLDYICFFLFFFLYGAKRDVHSFPTRPSSVQAVTSISRLLDYLVSRLLLCCLP